MGPKDFADLSPLIKNTRRKFLLPASDQLNADAPITLNNLKSTGLKLFLQNRNE
jgi:uroporphyrinogen-III synthase